ncbi:TetR/AcrR family transcriptional regulator [Heyndrickxia acidiproducens]|uniref:TetR/AcrR family transcriptional regulator n=1 Tax=Heyndrickxia acidiproducens TaxID=1121084 RepID=UPI0003668265|nr:TetR/AcrR family transcriptional regulator [Heyndrickxia acidiproducens]
MPKYNLLEAMMAQSNPAAKQTDKKQKIVGTAIKLFAEKGYANTPTSEIAKEAGVAEGTIFRHFGTKDNLLITVIVPFLKESIPSMAEELFHEILSKNIMCFEDFLRELIKDRMKFIKENKEIFQIVIKELLYNEGIKKELIPYFVKNIGPRLLHLIQTYQEHGELADIPAEKICNMIFIFIAGNFVTRFVLLPNDSGADEESEIESMVRFVMDGIRKK